MALSYSLCPGGEGGEYGCLAGEADLAAQIGTVGGKREARGVSMVVSLEGAGQGLGGLLLVVIK